VNYVYKIGLQIFFPKNIPGFLPFKKAKAWFLKRKKSTKYLREKRESG